MNPKEEIKYSAPSLENLVPSISLKACASYKESKSAYELERSDTKKPSYRQKKTIDNIEIFPNSHKTRHEKLHSPLNIFDTFTPTHFSPKNISPLKKKQSKFAFSSNSLLSKKSLPLEEFDTISEKMINNEEKVMTSELKAFMLDSFKKHFIFGFMDEGILENILSSMQAFTLKPAQVLLNTGEPTKYLYLLESGCIKAFKDDTIVEKYQYNPGNLIFADLFFNNLPSQLKYAAVDESVVWGLTCSQISLIILQITEKKYKENRAFIDPLLLFSNLTEAQKDSLAYSMKTLKFAKDSTIIKEDEIGLNFYILKQGLLISSSKDKFLYYLKPGDCFGENIFLEKTRGYTVKVESESAECLSVSKKTVLELFDENYETMIFKNLVRKTIRDSEFLSKLTCIQIDKTTNLMKYKRYKKGEELPIIHKPSILMLLTGKLGVPYSKKEVLEGKIIGEELIKDKKLLDEIPIYYCKEDSLLAFCEIEELEKELGDGEDLLKIIEKNRSSHENLILLQKKKDTPNISLHKKIKPEEIQVLKILGEGSSGIVLLVDYEGKFYALKIISKGWIIEKELEEYMRNEKEIYSFIDFQFITKLSYTFKDDISIYFLIEFVNGIEFFSALCEIKLLSSDQARFYIAILVLCLQYLHNKGIIHRDIKPENMIIDDTGYLKLCDLGIAKLMLSNATRTYTLLGTNFYIAPEMIIGKGYSFPIDFWALGICLYELVCGDVPFGSQEEEPYNIYQSIVMDKLAFPSFFKDKSTKDLIKALLIKTPEKRMGKTFGEIKGHAFFNNFQWDELMLRKLLPPIIPKNEKLTLKKEEISVLYDKKKTLEVLLASPDIVKVKEMTKNVKSEFENWDDIF